MNAASREDADDQARRTVEAVYRAESRRVLATLIRLLGDFDRAEEALHDAFIAAVERWPRDGVPENPRAWLVSTGRFKAIDGMRRRARFDAALGELATQIEAATSDASVWDEDTVEDDRLRLIFTCCHPALTPDAQVALTLREVCGLTTEEIAHAFLTTPSTVAQRIVRAKAKIRDARIPYQVPARADMPARLDTVLHVVYLVFNEGYSASAGDVADAARSLRRGDSARTAPRGAAAGGRGDRPAGADAAPRIATCRADDGVRRAGPAGRSGSLALEPRADRGRVCARRAGADRAPLRCRTRCRRRSPPSTPRPRRRTATDWAQIVALYDVLLRADPSPVVELNRAAAIAMRDGPAAGIAIVDAILARGDLDEYQFAHSARAELCRRLGKIADARESYTRALGARQTGARAPVSRAPAPRPQLTFLLC